VRVVRSRIVKGALLAVLVIVAGLATLVAAAHLEFVRARVLEWAVASVSRDFGIRIEADSLRYNLLAASAELRNARVSAPDQPVFFQAQAIRVGLIRGALPGVEIDRLEIDRPHLTIVRHADGTTNLPASQSSSGSQPAPLHFGRIALKMLTVEVKDEMAGHRLLAAPIDLELDASSPGAFGPTPISARLGSTNPQSPPQAISGTLAGRLGFDGSRLTVDELRLDIPEGRLALGGWIDVVAETRRVEAHATLESDLARASRFLSARDLSLTGSVTADAGVSGDVADPTVRIKVLGPSVAVGSAPSASISANATYASGRVEIESLSISSDAGAIDMNGVIALTPPPRRPRDNQVAGRIENLDVDRLLDAFGIRRPVRLGTVVAGQIGASLDATASLDADAWRRASMNASLTLTPTGSDLSLGGRLTATADRGRWRVDHSLRSPSGRASLDGVLSGNVEQLDDPQTHSLSGRSRLRIEEVRTLLPLLQQAGVSLPLPVAEADGIVDVEIAPRGTIAAPALNATINGRGIRVPGIDDSGEVDSKLAIDRRALDIESIDARLGPLQLSAAGAYTWRGEIQGRFDAAMDDLSALASVLNMADVPLAGSADLKGSVRGAFASLQGEGQLTARNVSAYGVAIGPVTARLRLDDGRGHVDGNAPDLAAHVVAAVDTSSPFSFDAAIDLDRSPLSALLSAPQTKQLQAEGTIAAALRARGAIARLADTAGELELRAVDARVAGVPIALDTRAVVSFAPSALSAAPLLVRVGRDTQVRLQGALSTNGATGIDIQVQSAIADLLTVAGPALPDVPIEAGSSRVTLDLHVGGTLAAPRPSGNLALDAASLKYADFPPISDVILTAQIEPARIALNRATALWQGASLSADGAIPLRMIVPPPRPDATGLAAWGANWLNSLPDEPRTATLNARVTGVTKDALASFVEPAQLEQVAMTAAATLTADADRLALDALRASIVLDQASLTLAGVPFTQSTPTRVRLEGGRARLEELRWDAQGNELRASGTADLIGPAPALDLAVNGALDLRVLGAFGSGIASGGLAYTAFTVTGPLSSPQIVGSADVSSGELRLDTPSVSAADFNGTIAVDAARRATIYLNGDINGGPTYVEGEFALDEISAPHGRLSVAAWGVMLEYPEGFQTESNANLSLALGPASTLSGRVDVVSGLYREPLVISRNLLTSFGTSAAPSVTAESSFLQNLKLDVTIATANEIRIDNNYGRLNLTANLQATGSAAQPGILGRIEAEPDGEVYLAGNTYRIQTLTVDLANPRVIAPEVTFLAETRVGRTPIEIALQCGATGPCEREVRSQESGTTNQQAEAMLFGISANPDEAGAQLARLLSGELLGLVSGSVGLDTLRLEQGGGTDLFDDPTLVAGDVNPASRLTIGKRVGDRVELAYSQDLSQNGFVMSTTYFAPLGISMRALLLDNEDRSYEFRHEPPIGVRRRPRPAARPAVTVAAVRFSGTLGFAESELRGQLRLTDGDRFDFAAWQADGDRLRRFYQAAGYFESRVRARRTLAEQVDPAAAGTVTLEYTIERGRPTRLEVSGYPVPDEVRQRIVGRWASSVFDRFLERDVDRIVRDYLFADGRPGATVTPTLATTDEARTLRVEIDPGPAAATRLQIEGNERVPTPRVLAVAQSLGPAAAWLEPAVVEEGIKRLYQAEGLLSADVDVSAPNVQNGESVVRVAIHEGEPWQIGRVTLGGADQLSGGAAAADLRLVPGNQYDPRVIAESLTRLEQQFRNEGFLDVRVASETVLDPATYRADVHALVEPGPRTVLASVAVDGADDDAAKIAQALNVSAGMPVGASALGAARRRLYESGRYRSVEIALEPAPAAAPFARAAGERPVVARIRVEERPRYSLRYGLAVNSTLNDAEERETRLGFAADFENRNLFGRGLTAGLSARLRGDQQVVRVFLGANRFFMLPLRSTVFLSRSREDFGSDPAFQGVADVTEISAEQMYRVRGLLDLRYGYEMGRNHTSTSSFDLTARVARLTTSALVDRRNDPFDPVHGWFSSANFELSRPGLGSDLSFLKSYLQLYQFTPLRRGVVLASAVRVGLARTFRDEDLIPSEQFFAGGATSVRGYREDDLGPRSIFGDAEGGSALFIANSEARFPIYRRMRGVGFVDLGNIYPTTGDLLKSVQVSTGGGIRLGTPVGLFRVDIGVPVNPRPIDPKWRFHFGLGHAF
jgi:outer membrane protein assembly factor BamA